MRLAIINDWFSDKFAVFTNRDGFLRSMQVLRDTYGWETKFFKKGDPGLFKHPYVDVEFSSNPGQAAVDWKPDAILYFADLTRPVIGELKDVKIPKAICFSGGPRRDFEKDVDLIFVESKSYLEDFKSRGLNAVQAFGTNTELFKPYTQPKVFDAIFPATFAGWKRHNLFAEAMGPRGLACGWWQPHEPETVDVCFKNGTAVLHHQNAESICLLLNMSKTCVVTSANNGGSQRTVLEAMACNIPVIATIDSDKTTEYIKACGVGNIVDPNPSSIREAVDGWVKNPHEINTRQWILDNYSEYIYAKKIKEGIESILK